MSNPIVPSWNRGLQQNLHIPLKYKKVYYAVVLCSLILILISGWNLFRLHGYNEQISLLKNTLSQHVGIANSIVSENRKLDEMEKRFDKLLPLLSTRYSISHIFNVLGNQDVMPESAHLAEVVLKVTDNNNLLIGLNLVSAEGQLSKASQSLDELRTNFSKSLNVTDKSVALSEGKLTSYNAISEPVARSHGKKNVTSGFELGEEWTYTLNPIPKSQLARVYDLFSKHMPVKGKK